MDPPAFPLATRPAGPGPCPACRALAAPLAVPFAALAAACGPDLGVAVLCACAGRTPTLVRGHRADVAMPAASVGKLAVVAAALDAHAVGRIDLTAPYPHPGSVTRYRDSLDVLAGVPLPWAAAIGLGLCTSANSVLDALFHHLGTPPTFPGVVVPSGYDDATLDGPIRDHTITARTAVTLLVRVLGAATGPLAPIAAGLVNGARTTRLVHELDDRWPALLAPNKTGTLTGVRNDVTVLWQGTAALGVGVLCAPPDDDSARTDAAFARFGATLARLRYPPH